MAEPLVSPPRARLAFRVSIIGHQPDRLPSDPAGLEVLRGRMSAVLFAARRAVLAFQDDDKDAGLYASDPPLLRAVTPLAEGADRLFAEAALGLGYALTCPMPFHQAEFEEDFAPGKDPGAGPAGAFSRAARSRARRRGVGDLRTGRRAIEPGGHRQRPGRGRTGGAQPFRPDGLRLGRRPRPRRRRERADPGGGDLLSCAGGLDRRGGAVPLDGGARPDRPQLSEIARAVLAGRRARC